MACSLQLIFFHFLPILVLVLRYFNTCVVVRLFDLHCQEYIKTGIIIDLYTKKIDCCFSLEMRSILCYYKRCKLTLSYYLDQNFALQTFIQFCGSAEPFSFSGLCHYYADSLVHFILTSRILWLSVRKQFKIGCEELLCLSTFLNIS